VLPTMHSKQCLICVLIAEQGNDQDNDKGNDQSKERLKGLIFTSLSLSLYHSFILIHLLYGLLEVAISHKLQLQ